MTDFFTADTHFYHSRIIKYCNRPFAPDVPMTEEERDVWNKNVGVPLMNEHMIQIWNETVGVNDTVRIVGDFAFGSKTQQAEILSRLNGTKILIWGNHDYLKPKQYTSIVGFVEFKYYDIIDDMFITHFPMMSDEDIAKDLLKRDEADSNYTSNGFKRMKDNFLSTGLKKVISGHTHCFEYQDLVSGIKNINVGVDRWNFKPISLDEVKKYLTNL